MSNPWIWNAARRLGGISASTPLAKWTQPVQTARNVINIASGKGWKPLRYATNAGMGLTAADTVVSAYDGVNTSINKAREMMPDEAGQVAMKRMLYNGTVGRPFGLADSNDRAFTNDVGQLARGEVAQHMQDPTGTTLGWLSQKASYLSPATYAWHQARRLGGAALDNGQRFNETDTAVKLLPHVINKALERPALNERLRQRFSRSPHDRY